MDREGKSGGARLWYVADGWLPLREQTENTGFEGHEAIMILNCGDEDANVLMDLYFEDREPVLGVPLKAPARRVKCFRMDHAQEVGGAQVRRLEQYALRFRSDRDIVVQYGRMDVSQPNLAYIGMMAYPG